MFGIAAAVPTLDNRLLECYYRKVGLPGSTKEKPRVEPGLGGREIEMIADIVSIVLALPGFIVAVSAYLNRIGRGLSHDDELL